MGQGRIRGTTLHYTLKAWSSNGDFRPDLLKFNQEARE
jgi:hypothetical protein